MFRKSLILGISILIASSPVVESFAQTAGVLKAPGIGRALSTKKKAKTCFKKPVLCGAATGLAVGGAILMKNKLIEKEKREKAEDPSSCKGGFVDVYRVVSALEHEISVRKQQYFLAPGTVEKKYFWRSISDVNWFLNAKLDRERYVITSKACLESFRHSVTTLDSGHPQYIFDRVGLKRLSHDAKQTGGIKSLGVVK